ncbi:Octanoyltransferase [Candidatus Jidaibacter acanthamoeba]|uniref:Octanoyltransferase n=1 Tax=Candidatus Jidaibacter acanthamoebae TaxID=86105 RepID=A0A0C1QL68_9RICK|nr:lipoyl(octanoyl) transferase LipB [Candidatus Jidaibacter acanthamoeba]KIE04863.1 Octanoyltransferase [Candidatus Jidaibacter acanthamoeba]
MPYPLDQIYSKTLINYPDALAKMEFLAQEISEQKRNSTLWLLQHPPIYTAGSGAQREDLIEEKFPVYQSGRGGKYTYHDPGQRIVYLMINLKQIQTQPDIREFIKRLENSAITTFKEIGINTFLKEGLIGIWTKKDGIDHKIAAIGIRVKRWVTYHGIAFNISPKLTNFSGIIPCGIKEYGVTSLSDLGVNVSFTEFDQIFVKHFCASFNFYLSENYENG